MKSQKTALVTGASKGIGRAISVELARCGYGVLINYLKDKTQVTIRSNNGFALRIIEE